MILTKNDKLFLLTNFALTGLVAATLAWHMSLKIEYSGDQKPVGFVKAKRLEVLRKYETRVVWEEIETDAPLYPFDSILTKENADVTLKLNNGIEFELSPNSMVVLENFKEQAALKVRSGKINTKSEGDGTAFILTEQGQAIDVSNADATMSVSEEGGLDMSVNAGAVEIQTEDGTTESVAEGEKLTIDKEAKIKKSKINVKLELPADGTVEVTAKPKKLVSFSWSSATPINKTTLKLSQNPNFAKSGSIKVNGKTSTTATLSPGTWYWKIQGTDKEGSPFESTTSVVRIIQDSPPKLILPRQNMKITYTRELPLVNFAWRKSKLCSITTMSVAYDKEFKNLAQKDFVSDTNRVNLKFDKPGTYYWKVGCNYGNAIKSSSKPIIRSFTIAKTDVPSAPSMITPSGTEFYISKVKNSEALLSWRALPDAKSYLVRIFSDRGQKNLIHEANVGRNVLTLPQETAKKGAYYWTIRAVISKDLLSKESKVRQFRVTSLSQVALYSPSKGHQQGLSFDEKKIESLRFTWERLRGNFYYVLTISSDRSHANTWKQFGTTNNSYTLRELPKAGKFFWKVTVYDRLPEAKEKTAYKNETPIVVSKSRSMNFTESLGSTIAQFPKDKSQVKGEKLIKMKFKWKKVSGANQYIFKLYYKSGDKARLLLTKTTSNTTFSLSDVSRYNDGTFIWEITPVRTKNNKVVLTGQNMMSEFDVKGLTLPKPEILPEQPDMIISIQ